MDYFIKCINVLIKSFASYLQENKAKVCHTHTYQPISEKMCAEFWVSCWCDYFAMDLFFLSAYLLSCRRGRVNVLPTHFAKGYFPCRSKPFVWTIQYAFNKTLRKIHQIFFTRLSLSSSSFLLLLFTPLRLNSISFLSWIDFRIILDKIVDEFLELHFNENAFTEILFRHRNPMYQEKLSLTQVCKFISR